MPCQQVRMTEQAKSIFFAEKWFQCMQPLAHCCLWTVYQRLLRLVLVIEDVCLIQACSFITGVRLGMLCFNGVNFDGALLCKHATVRSSKVAKVCLLLGNITSRKLLLYRLPRRNQC